MRIINAIPARIHLRQKYETCEKDFFTFNYFNVSFRLRANGAQTFADARTGRRDAEKAGLKKAHWRKSLRVKILIRLRAFIIRERRILCRTRCLSLTAAIKIKFTMLIRRNIVFIKIFCLLIIWCRAVKMFLNPFIWMKIAALSSARSRGKLRGEIHLGILGRRSGDGNLIKLARQD